MTRYERYSFGWTEARSVFSTSDEQMRLDRAAVMQTPAWKCLVSIFPEYVDNQWTVHTWGNAMIAIVPPAEEDDRLPMSFDARWPATRVMRKLNVLAKENFELSVRLAAYRDRKRRKRRT